MDNIIVLFDTEFTAWEGSMKRNWSKKNEYKELVQLAALKVKMGKKIEIIDELNIIIKPVKNPVLSQYFIDLTGITNNDVKNKGVLFKKALSNFYSFCKNNNKLVNVYSYGNDYIILKENMNYNKIPKKSKFRKWEEFFFDIRPIFDFHGINTNKYTSGTVYKSLNIKPKNPIVHNAMWDTMSLFLTVKALNI